MKTIAHNLKLQRGVASLLTAIILLICITLVALFTSKTVLMETKMAADDYRTSQATAAAQAGMERAMAYFLNGGVDQVTPTGADFTTPTAAQMPSAASCALPVTTGGVAPPAFSESLASGGQSTIAMFYFVNTPTFDHDNNTGTAAIANPCDCTTSNCFATSPKDKAMVIAKGWSDDCTAVRTVSQCVGVFPIFSQDKGPSQPMVTHGGVGIGGNVTVINRYTASTVWTGGTVDAANAAFGTWLAPSAGVTTCGDSSNCAVSNLNDGCGSSGCPAGSAQIASNWKGGVGLDIVQNDNTLKNMTADQMFALFFGSNSRADLRALADTVGHVYATAAAVPANTTGLIYLDSGGQLPIVGTATSPAIVIASGGNLVTTASKFYGVLYATGQIGMGSGDQIYGSLVTESNSGVAASGHPQVIFVPMGGDGGTTSNPLIGTMSAIPGSWKDW